MVKICTHHNTLIINRTTSYEVILSVYISSMDKFFIFTRGMKKESIMKQSQAKKRDNAMTNKILMG